MKATTVPAMMEGMWTEAAPLDLPLEALEDGLVDDPELPDDPDCPDDPDVCVDIPLAAEEDPEGRIALIPFEMVLTVVQLDVEGKEYAAEGVC